ncbi:MAG TPA: hypothetical protein VN690_07970 [Terriglobales bacterium]|nr:hypothetical protein [Terriglobales bacterium]
MTSKLTPNSVGFLLGMRFHFNPWEALEFEIGSSNNGALFSSAALPSGAAPPLPISAAMRRISLNEVVTASAASHIVPFLLAGGGAAEFQPTRGAPAGFKSEIRAMATVGVGIDIRILHIGVRAEVEELFYKTPDFHNSAITGAWTHVAQPSAGLIFAF